MLPVRPEPRYANSMMESRESNVDDRLKVNSILIDPNTETDNFLLDRGSTSSQGFVPELQRRSPTYPRPSISRPSLETRTLHAVHKGRVAKPPPPRPFNSFSPSWMRLNNHSPRLPHSKIFSPETYSKSSTMVQIPPASMFTSPFFVGKFPMSSPAATIHPNETCLSQNPDQSSECKSRDPAIGGSVFGFRKPTSILPKSFQELVQAQVQSAMKAKQLVMDGRQEVEAAAKGKEVDTASKDGFTMKNFMSKAIKGKLPLVIPSILQIPSS